MEKNEEKTKIIEEIPSEKKDHEIITDEKYFKKKNSYNFIPEEYILIMYNSE
jgi:hypothetical protein